MKVLICARLGAHATMLAKDELTHLVARLAPQIANDPRPAPVLRVGAMGHRQFPHGGEALASAVAETVLASIRNAVLAALAEPETAARFDGAPELTVISPLAEGADQLVAAAGQKTGYRIGAILPFDVADYERTFDLSGAEASIARLRAFLDAADGPGGDGVFVLDGDPSPAKRDAAFLFAATQVTHWSEIVLAILTTGRWESQTGQSVRAAIDTGMPVICIDPADGRISLYLDTAEVTADERDQRLATAVRKYFAPPDKPLGAHDQVHEGHAIGLSHYRGERVNCDVFGTTDFEYRGPYCARIVAPWWARWCSGLNRAIERSLRKKRPPSAAPSAPPPTASELPFAPHQAAPFVRQYLHFHRADVLANAYAEMYRSAHLLIAILGVASVALGAVGAVFGHLATLSAGTEFVCFVFALALVWISNRQAWLARWTNYRLLAEIHRYAKFLFVAGLPSPFGDAAPVRQVWTRDHTEQVLRTYPLAVPGRGRTPDAGAVAAARAYILGQCIDDQVRFHQATAPARQRMAKFLRQASTALSVVTVLVLAVKFLADIFLDLNLNMAMVMSPVSATGEMLAIVLPALTAAVLALRAYGEHDVVAKRSMAMIESLGHERRRVAAASNLESLGGATMRVTRTLLSEVGGWVDLFVDKHLEA